MAFLYAAIGEKDQAFSFLEKAYEDRDWYLNTLQVNPGFDSPALRPALSRPAAPHELPAVVLQRPQPTFPI